MIVSQMKAKVMNCRDIVLKNKYWIKPTIRGEEIRTFGGAGGMHPMTLL